MSDEEREQPFNWSLIVEVSWQAGAGIAHSRLEFTVPSGHLDQTPEGLIEEGISTILKLTGAAPDVMFYNVSLSRESAEAPAAERQATVRGAIQPAG